MLDETDASFLVRGRLASFIFWFTKLTRNPAHVTCTRAVCMFLEVCIIPRSHSGPWVVRIALCGPLRLSNVSTLTVFVFDARCSTNRKSHEEPAAFVLCSGMVPRSVIVPKTLVVCLCFDLLNRHHRAARDAAGLYIIQRHGHGHA
jgi:hypothetical protein